MSAPVAPASPPRRRRRWLAVPLGLLALVLVLLVVLWVRGTWAETQARDPTSPAEGPVCQLYQAPDGRKTVRCAVVLPYPPECVWSVVTDYSAYAKLLPYLADIATEPKGDGVVHMTGKAKATLWGWWDFALDVREEHSGEQWSATWDNASGEVRINRGGWTVSPAGNGQTLLVLSLECEISHTPTFFLRNVFLHRLPKVLHAVERDLQQRPAGT